jgi:hypothetical protein
MALRFAENVSLATNSGLIMFELQMSNFGVISSSWQQQFLMFLKHYSLFLTKFVKKMITKQRDSAL